MNLIHSGMTRLALVVFIAVVGALVVFSLLPRAERVAPEGTVLLHNTTVTLYPQADPAAVWFFASESVAYDPRKRETTLSELQRGERVVDDEVDFTLAADELIIDRREDIRAAQVTAYIIADDLTVAMSEKGERVVLIDQREGLFHIPRATLAGGSLGESVFEDMRASFDFMDFTSGGPGTVGYAEFILD